MRRLKRSGFWRSDQGFTLAEVLIVIVLMGIVFAIASSAWLGVVESREVDSATNQFVADMRLAHTSATNRLGKAQIIFSNTGAAVSCNGVSADYCLVLPVGTGTQSKPRFLPGNTVATSPNLLADTLGTTSTIEFAADGSAKALGTLDSVSGITDNCPASTPAGVPRIKIASSDDNPRHCITFNTATSRIRID